MSSHRSPITLLTALAVAQSFGLDAVPAHAKRYELAEEFVEVVLSFGRTSAWPGPRAGTPKPGKAATPEPRPLPVRGG